MGAFTSVNSPSKAVTKAKTGPIKGRGHLKSYVIPDSRGSSAVPQGATVEANSYNPSVSLGAGEEDGGRNASTSLPPMVDGQSTTLVTSTDDSQSTELTNPGNGTQTADPNAVSTVDGQSTRAPNPSTSLEHAKR